MFDLFASHPFNLYMTVWLVMLAFAAGYCLGRRDALPKPD